MFLLTLSGCLSPVSLDAYGYVISLGVDGGKDARYCYTFALQRALSEQNVDSEGGAILLSIEADDLFSAVSELEDNIPYSLNFSRTNFMIVGSGAAGDGAIENLVSVSFDSLKIRTSAVVIVTEGPVAEFIGGMYSNNEANIGKLQSALMTDREKTGMVAVMSVSRLIEACATGCFDYTAAYGSYDGSIVTDSEQKKLESEGKNPLDELEPGGRAGGLKAYISGTALFDGWRFSGVLTREETMFLNMVTGEFVNGVFSSEFNGSNVSVLLSLRRSSIEVGEDLSVRVFVSLDAGIRQKDAALTAEETDEWLTETLPGLIEEKLASVFLKCRAAGSDAMRFGSELVKRFQTYNEWESFGWKTRYLSFEPVFTVTAENTEKHLSEDMQ